MAKKSSFGSIKAIKGREGLWFVKRQGARSFTKFAGQTKAAAERFRSRVWVLCQDGCSIEEALAHVAGDPPPRSSRTTFAELASQYENEMRTEGTKKATTLSCESYMVGLLQEEPWASEPAEALDRGSIRAWVHGRVRDGARPSTINNQLSCFSAIVRYAQDAGWVDDGADNPFPRCRLRRKFQKRRVGLDLEEFVALMLRAEEACPPEACRLLLVGGLVGWRLGDFSGLSRGDVDLGYQLKKAPAPVMRADPATEKMSRPKLAFLVGPAVDAVSASLERPGLDAAPVFTQPHGTTWRDPKRINKWLRLALAKVKDSEIPAWKKEGDHTYLPFSFHGLRYTHRTIAAALGIAMHVTDAQVGHKSRYYTEMSSHYTTVPESELLRAARLVSAGFVKARARPRSAASP